MFEIYFSNTRDEHNQYTRMACCPDIESAYAVYDALTKAFLHVTLYNPDGTVNRNYNNIF